MSTVSSISSSGLSQFYQTLSVSGSQQPVDQTDSADATDSTTATDATGVVTDASGATAATSAGGAAQVAPHRHHGGHGGGGELFKKLQTAVTSALQTAQGDDSSDPNQVVEDAIAKVLQGNGDPAANLNATGTPASPDSVTSDSGDAATSGSTQGGSDSRQAFFQTLQSFGIDPQQFHSDFLVAVQNAQGGQADPSSAFQSFPPGTLLDTTA